MNFNKRTIPSLIILFLLIIVAGCTCNKKKYNVDVSNVKVNTRIERFDKDFLAIPHSNPQNQLQLLRSKYPTFYPFYIEQILGIGNVRDSAAVLDSLLSFFTSPYYKRMFDTTEVLYGNIDDVQAGLIQGMKHYHYYFPALELPNILTYVNGPRCFTFADSILAIGLDNYLGSDYYFYKIVQPPIPDFLIRKLTRAYIVPNAMQVLATNFFPYRDDGKKLLDEMIYNGKLYFLLNHILPDTPDSLIVGYKGKDLKWCNENESEIWKYFIKNNLLYQTDQLVYKKYVNDGPNTSGMPPEAPGNIASWVGWRIVQRYAEKHSELSLLDIMKEQDSQKILTESKYKP